MTRSTPPSTTIDIFGEVLFDCFPDGRRVLGGAPFNVAWHLHAFGAAPCLISAVGDDADGSRVRQAMLDWGMDLSGLQTDPDHPTGIVAVSIQDGEPEYQIIPDRAFDHIRADAVPPAGQLLYHGTLALRGAVTAGALEHIVSAGHALRILDVNLRDPWWSLAPTLAHLRGAAWVKLNRDELARLAGADEPLARTRLIEIATDFRRRHALGALVVTLGSAGALAIGGDDEPIQVAPPSRSRVVDTVGAGDAFAAALILGLIHEWPLATTLERAQSFASRIVTQPGATAADPDLYRPYREHWGLSAP